MKTQKMYMFSIDCGIEEIDAFIKDNKIILVYGEKQYSFHIGNEIIVHNKGENINYVYDCLLIDCDADLPEVAWISTSIDDIKAYIDNMFAKYNRQ